MKKFIEKLNEIEAKAIKDRDEATRAHAEVIGLMEAENERTKQRESAMEKLLYAESKGMAKITDITDDHLNVGRPDPDQQQAFAKRFYDDQVRKMCDESGLTEKQRLNEAFSVKRLNTQVEQIQANNIEYAEQISEVKRELKFENQSHPAFTNWNNIQANQKIDEINKVSVAKALKLGEAGKKANTLMLFSYVRHGNIEWSDFPSVTYLIVKFAEDHPRIWADVTPNFNFDILVGNVGYALLELAIKVNGKCVSEIEAFAADELTLEDVLLCKSLFNAMLKGNKGECTYITGGDVVGNVMTIFDHVKQSSCKWSSFVSARTLIRHFGNDHPDVYLNPIDKPGSVYRVNDIGYSLLGLAIELDGKCEKEYQLFARGVLTYDDIIAASPMLKSISAQAGIEYLRSCSSKRGQSDQSGIEYP